MTAGGGGTNAEPKGCWAPKGVGAETLVQRARKATSRETNSSWLALVTFGAAVAGVGATVMTLGAMGAWGGVALTTLGVIGEEGKLTLVTLGATGARGRATLVTLGTTLGARWALNARVSTSEASAVWGKRPRVTKLAVDRGYSRVCDGVNEGTHLG